ncbi:MAG: hypothetical protein ACXV4B_08835, partial [Halobacteriota archaeon]
KRYVCVYVLQILSLNYRYAAVVLIDACPIPAAVAGYRPVPLHVNSEAMRETMRCTCLRITAPCRFTSSRAAGSAVH